MPSGPTNWLGGMRVVVDVVVLRPVVDDAAVDWLRKEAVDGAGG